uniref:Rhotekin 2b n=1 Tax=Stegastes partitus TaxID=144197 RepID=A0A3B5B8J4_9TELE
QSAVRLVRSLSVLPDCTESGLLQQIEREVRMREGASKLLGACSQREQALEASKSLLTCNARILALLSQLQKRRKAQILQRVGCRSDGEPSEDVEPCTGKVALSDLRIPLMWKDSEYFKNKGELHRCAVFCLLQCGTEIHDTDLVMVDRTLTDICFEDTIIFSNVAPGFQLRVELYSSCVVEDFSPAPLGSRKVSLLGGSLGRSSGKKIRAAFESAAFCGSVSTGGGGRPGSMSPPLSPDLSALGAKYNLLAHTTLRIEHVQEGFKTHDLSLSATEDSPFWLPLYGNMCCRLAAQPQCMTETVISGQIRIKVIRFSYNIQPFFFFSFLIIILIYTTALRPALPQLEEDFNYWENVYGVLRRQTLLCYQSEEDLDSEEEPLLVIPIKKVGSNQSKRDEQGIGFI